jgi:hypothetical protein
VFPYLVDVEPGAPDGLGGRPQEPVHEAGAEAGHYDGTGLLRRAILAPICPAG